jgi:hypothetical protein
MRLFGGDLVDDRQEYERNNAAYRRLREQIRESYPQGWFVAIADERITGAAADFRQLARQLRAEGKDPRRALIVEAGTDYPESVTIFS